MIAPPSLYIFSIRDKYRKNSEFTTFFEKTCKKRKLNVIITVDPGAVFFLE